MRKQTKIYLSVLISILLILFALGMLSLAGQVKMSVSAFCASEEGSLVVCYNRLLVIVERDGSVQKIKHKITHPLSVTIDQKVIKITDYDSYVTYDLSTGQFGNRIDAAPRYDGRKQDLRKEIQAGGSVYSYKNILGWYEIRETQQDGAAIIRYRVPVFDYVIKLGAIVFGVVLLVSIPLFIIHIYKNYRYSVNGWKAKER